MSTFLRPKAILYFSHILCFIISGFYLSAQNSRIEKQRNDMYATENPSSEFLKQRLALTQELRAYSTDSVLRHASACLSLAEKLNDARAQAEAYRQLAWSRGLMQQNIGQLIQDGNKALELAKVADDSLEIVQAGLILANGYVAIQNTSQASEYATLALAYGERNKEGKVIQAAYSTFSYLALMTDLNTSLSYRKKSLKQAAINQDTLNLAMGYSQIATLLKYQKSDSVEYYLKEAKRLFQLKEAPVYEGILYYSLAEYYGDLGYGDSLLFYGLKADESAKKTNYVQAARVAKALLFAYYFNRQEYESAAPFAREALEIEKKRPSINYVSAFVDVARVEAYLQRPDSAEFYFQAAIQALNVLKSPRFEVLVRSYYGEFLMNQGNYPKALTELSRGKKLADASEEAAIQDFVLLLLAKAAFKTGRYKDAKTYYQEAIDLGNTANEADLLSEGYSGLAESDSALGNWSEAFINQQLFQRWNDSLQSRSYNEQTAEMETRFETVQKEAQITEQKLKIKQGETENKYLTLIAVVLAIAGAIVVGLLLQLKKRNTEVKLQREKLSVLNDSKDRLFAMIAHDLRGPITGFQSVGKIFDHYVKKEEFGKLGTISQKINQQSDHLKQLLDNLLNWSLQQLGLYEAQSENIKLKTLGEEILNRYEAHALAKGNQLTLDIPEDLHWVGDKNGLSVVLNNLIGNANKFTEKGQIKLAAVSHTQSLEIVLEDTGKGMSAEQLSKLRQDFRLETQKGTAGEKGTGLGFQIIHQLLAHWNARLSIESEEGVGTQISIHLPMEPSFA